jgi:5-methylcytosine-specific restriction endonuclease McrA
VPPTSAPTRCTVSGCGRIALDRGRCANPEHQRKPWAGRASTQERYGLSGSKQQELHRRILKRDEYVCYVCHLTGADNVDHIIPIELGGARTDPANLAAIHEDPCHIDKTKREAAERRARRAAARGQFKPDRE